MEARVGSDIKLCSFQTVTTPSSLDFCTRSSMFSTLSRGFPRCKNYHGNIVMLFPIHPATIAELLFYWSLYWRLTNIQRLADWLSPIYREMKAGLLAGSYLQADETPFVIWPVMLRAKASKSGCGFTVIRRGWCLSGTSVGRGKPPRTSLQLLKANPNRWVWSVRIPGAGAKWGTDFDWLLGACAPGLSRSLGRRPGGGVDRAPDRTTLCRGESPAGTPGGPRPASSRACLAKPAGVAALAPGFEINPPPGPAQEFVGSGHRLYVAPLGSPEPL